MSLELRFKKAVYLVRNGPPISEASNEEKLEVYSLYKQSTEGDINIDQPWAFQLEARAKWEAWNAKKGMSKAEAQQKYIDKVAVGDANWENHPILKDFKA